MKYLQNPASLHCGVVGEKDNDEKECWGVVALSLVTEGLKWQGQRGDDNRQGRLQRRKPS